MFWPVPVLFSFCDEKCSISVPELRVGKDHSFMVFTALLYIPPPIPLQRATARHWIGVNSDRSVIGAPRAIHLGL